MKKLPLHCPSCDTELTVTRLSCPSCETEVSGFFELPLLLRLPGEDQAFIVEFVKASGSLKEMARQLGISYPTLRNRLDELIAKMEQTENK